MEEEIELLKEEIELLKDQLADVEAWIEKRDRQQIQLPLDEASKKIINSI